MSENTNEIRHGEIVKCDDSDSVPLEINGREVFAWISMPRILPNRPDLSDEFLESITPRISGYAITESYPGVVHDIWWVATTCEPESVWIASHHSHSSSFVGALAMLTGIVATTWQEIEDRNS